NVAVDKIVVTSSLPGEGKSAFSAALARSMSAAGRQVLLLDCDIRRGTISKMLGGVRVKGLTELVRGKAELENVLHLDRLTEVEFIASGFPVDDPQNAVRRVINDPDLKSLMEGYDTVIIDTPPTLAAPDAAMLASIATSVVYIVEWSETPREAVKAGLKSLDQFRVKVDGLILNKVRPDAENRYDYVSYGDY
ncbi:MAG: CpsD/CapB family tyrosine-protein kinase, partial [Pseudomonadota bacterium]